ncbi:MAG: helix-turn-helix transcriptional regulator [Phycisphaerales bacterium]|nr:helix-turn-helix transcriptional regulator [Phycisphaerales bacterium]
MRSQVMESTDQRSGYEGIRLARPIEVRGGAGDEGAGRLRLTNEEEAYLRRFLGELTDREREVVVTVCAEGTNEDAAKKLEVTLATLRTHLMKVNQKLGTSSKTDVVRFAADRVIRGYRSGDLGRGLGPGVVR